MTADQVTSINPIRRRSGARSSQRGRREQLRTPLEGLGSHQGIEGHAPFRAPTPMTLLRKGSIPLHYSTTISAEYGSVWATSTP